MNSLNVLLQQIGNLVTWFVFVAPWEQALRVRLGKHVQLLGAGWYLRIPFVDRVYRQTIRQRMFVVRPQVLTTRDGRTISVNGAIGFSVVDMLKLFNTLHDAVDTIESQIASCIAEFVATRSLVECTPLDIEKHVAASIDLTKYGLDGQEFRLTNYAVVRTYRLISGDLPSWSNGNALNTQNHDAVIQ